MKAFLAAPAGRKDEAPALHQGCRAGAEVTEEQAKVTDPQAEG
jgi:hypothetical protein